MHLQLTVVTGLGCIKGLSSHDCDCPLLLTSLQLIRSPAFNRAVQKAYRKINRLPDMEAKNGRGSMFATGLICTIKLIQAQEPVPRH